VCGPNSLLVFNYPRFSVTGRGSRKISSSSLQSFILLIKPRAMKIILYKIKTQHFIVPIATLYGGRTRNIQYSNVTHYTHNMHCDIILLHRIYDTCKRSIIYYYLCARALIFFFYCNFVRLRRLRIGYVQLKYVRFIMLRYNFKYIYINVIHATNCYCFICY